MPETGRQVPLAAHLPDAGEQPRAPRLREELMGESVLQLALWIVGVPLAPPEHGAAAGDRWGPVGTDRPGGSGCRLAIVKVLRPEDYRIAQHSEPAVGREEALVQGGPLRAAGIHRGLGVAEIEVEVVLVDASSVAAIQILPAAALVSVKNDILVLHEAFKAWALLQHQRGLKLPTWEALGARTQEAQVCAGDQPPSLGWSPTATSTSPGRVSGQVHWSQISTGIVAPPRPPAGS
eukprot:CAMPEP_0175442676 /NCGR_PEP_ID=MMETSP0095-20121207/58271_1 /TAXON_ID=311494 /ORGANISM="Alexandrium monilatum, Strain CCMP3105" /LENGTH=234 /DNA_ID=CAMNT_0016742713 /DNA_START=108 /DNA_END=810 /DNA_ORIENTATION=+